MYALANIALMLWNMGIAAGMMLGGDAGAAPGAAPASDRPATDVAGYAGVVWYRDDQPVQRTGMGTYPARLLMCDKEVIEV
ncbi:MAG: hypothetical protein ACLTR8_03240 [Oscillospiraceae bacterium]